MMILKLPVLLLALASHSYAAPDPCETVQSQKMEEIKIMSNLSLVACGEVSMGQVQNLTLLQVKDGNAQSIFEGDAAFKAYTVKAKNLKLYINESLQGTGSRLVQRSTSCSSDACKVTISECQWRRFKPEEKAVAKTIKKVGTNFTENDLEKLFFATLNGSKKAREFFSGNHEFHDAALSEEFETLAEDLKSFSALKCARP